jgi:PAS domain S-box-containing protein
MDQNEPSEILIRLGKFDDYKGPICLNTKTSLECEFCNQPCDQVSSKIIMDALSLDKINLYFEEDDSFYQSTNFLVPNSQVRGNSDKFSLIFKLKNNKGRIRTDLLLRIRSDFIERVKEIENIGESEFAQQFCMDWENHLKTLKYVTEFEEERLRTEAALNNANEILTANNLIIKVDLNGILSFLNPFAEKFFEYSTDELLGKNVFGTIFPKLDKEGVPKGTNLDGSIQHFLFNLENSEFKEIETISKDGSSKWVAWTNKPIYNKEGKLIEILCVGIDITSLKRTEQNLASEKALTQLYFDIAGVMLVVLDDQLKIHKINKKGIQLLNAQEEKVIGLDWVDNFIPKKDRRNVRKELEEVRNRKNEFNRNYIENKDGQKKLIFWHNAPIFEENGNFKGIICSGEDMTEQKEEEKKLIKAKAIKTLKDQMF